MRHVAARVFLASLALHAWLFAQSNPRPTDSDAPVDETTIQEVVSAYFRTDDPQARRAQRTAIERESAGAIDAVLRALRAVALWEAIGDPTVDIRASAGTDYTDVRIELPPEYDPAHAYPAVVIMPRPGIPLAQQSAWVKSMLSARAMNYVFVCPRRAVGGSFHLPVPRADNLSLMLRDVHKKIHIDSTRTYLAGVDRAADSAWVAAIGFPGLFAGVLTVSGYPRTPYPEQSYELLLPNLRNLPVLNVWVNPVGEDASSRAWCVGQHGRLIAKIAKDRGLPIESLELDAVAHDGRPGLHIASQTPVPARSRELFLRRMNASPTTITHRFRYAHQSGAYWVSQSGGTESTWVEDQLAILPPTTRDRHRFILDVLRRQLHLVEATVRDNRIDIRCGTGEITITPSRAMLDWAHPVELRVNGRRRRVPALKPSVATLLEIAATDWVFIDPPVARASLPVHFSPPNR